MTTDTLILVAFGLAMFAESAWWAYRFFRRRGWKCSMGIVVTAGLFAPVIYPIRLPITVAVMSWRWLARPVARNAWRYLKLRWKYRAFDRHGRVATETIMADDEGMWVLDPRNSAVAVWQPYAGSSR